MRFKYGKEFAVGLSLIVAVVILILGIRYFEDLPLFRGTYELYTSFEDASGLSPGNAVRINGVRAGAVDAVTLDPVKREVLVTFHLDRGITIPVGSQTEVSGIAALNSVHLKVHLGPTTAPPIEEGGYVPPVAEANFLGQLTENAPELVDRLDAVLANANQTFEEAEQLLENTDGDVALTLQAFRGAALTLDETLRAERVRLGRLLESLETTSATANELAVNLNEVALESGDSLSVAVTNLNRLLRRVDANIGELEPAVARLDSILVKIDEGEGTLGRLVNDPSLYVELDSAATNLNEILTGFQDDPARYLRHLRLVDIF